MFFGRVRLALLSLFVAVSAAAQSGGPGFSIPGYNEIQNNKTSVLPRRRRLNFVNGGCVDDVANASTDCTVSGSGGTGTPGGTVAGAVQYRVNGTTFGGDDNVIDDGAGTVTGKFRDKGGAVFNVKAFGNDIQATLNAAGANGIVWIPPGSYTTASTLTFVSGQNIVCPRGPQNNAGQATITFTGASGTLLAPANPNANTVNVTIQGCKFFGSTGADTVIDFANTSYSRIDGTYVAADKANAIGIRIYTVAGNQAYFNILDQVKVDVGQGIGLQLDAGANVNQIIGGKFGNSITGMSFVDSGGNTVVGTDFETNTTHVILSGTAQRNVFYGTHMETGTTGFSIASTATKTVLSDPSFATSVLTFVSDASRETVYRMIDPGSAGTFDVGLLHQSFVPSFSTGTAVSIDPQPLNNTLPVFWGLFRNVTTTGTRQFRVFKGDGTATVTASIDAGTGNLVVHDITANDLTVHDVGSRDIAARDITGRNATLTGFMKAPDPTSLVVLGSSDFGGAGTVTASDWMVSGHSKDQLYGINKLTSVTLTTSGTAPLSSTTSPFAGNEGGAGSVATIAATSDTTVLEAVDAANALPTSVFNSGVGWYASLQFRDGTAIPQSITVDAKYDDGAGGTTYTTVASTTTNISFFPRLDCTFPGLVSPNRIFAIRFTLTNWNSTGTARLITAALSHKSETPFPAYVRRDGDSRSKMLGTLAWSDRLGPITHVQGPTDQNLKVTLGSGKLLDVVGGAVRTDNQLISTIATGTAPLSVASTTAVANLHADNTDAINTTTGPTRLAIGAITDTQCLVRSGPTITSQACTAGAYTTVQEEGAGLTQRATLNFIGPAITAADDAGNTRTNVTLSQSPGGAGGTSVVDIQRQILTSGAALSGGGNLSADRTVTLSESPNSASVVGTGRQVLTSGAALSGGGDLSADRTVTLSESPNSASVVGTGRLVSAGTCLSGGGDLSADRTVSLAATCSQQEIFSAGIDLAQSALIVEIPNEGITGTVLNKPAKLTGAPSTAIVTGTGDSTGGIVGIVVGGAGTTGSAQIAKLGTASCVFDTATTAGDYVQNSAITPGDCRDIGASYPQSGGQVLGRVLSTNGAAGTYAVALFSQELPYALNPNTSSAVVGAARLINTTASQLTGGGNLTADRTLGFDYSTNPSGSPALSAGQCVWTSNTTGANKGGLVCEGATPDANETYIGVAEPTNDLNTITFPDASGTVAVSSSQTNNALVKYSGTGGQVAPSACTESGTVLAGCTAPAVAHNLLSATHGDTNSGATAPTKGDLVAGNATKWDRQPAAAADQQTLVSDSTTTRGMRWANRGLGLFGFPAAPGVGNQGFTAASVVTAFTPTFFTAQNAIQLYEPLVSPRGGSIDQSAFVLTTSQTAAGANPRCRTGIYTAADAENGNPSPSARVYVDTVDTDVSPFVLAPPQAIPGTTMAGTFTSSGGTVTGDSSLFTDVVPIAGDMLIGVRAGSGTIATSGTNVTGTGTAFQTDMVVGDIIRVTKTGTGTVTFSAASGGLTGTGTSFTTEVAIGDAIVAGGKSETVQSVPSNTSLTLDFPMEGVSGASFTVTRRREVATIPAQSGANALTTTASFAPDYAAGTAFAFERPNSFVKVGTGVITDVTLGSLATVTGSGTAFNTELRVGDVVVVTPTPASGSPALTFIVNAIGGALTLTADNTRQSYSGVSFPFRYQRGPRVSAVDTVGHTATLFGSYVKDFTSAATPSSRHVRDDVINAPVVPFPPTFPLTLVSTISPSLALLPTQLYHMTLICTGVGNSVGLLAVPSTATWPFWGTNMPYTSAVSSIGFSAANVCQFARATGQALKNPVTDNCLGSGTVGINPPLLAVNYGS